jgi:hypothetical protein
MRPRPEHAVRCLKAGGRADVWLIERPGGGRRVVRVWAFDPRTALQLLFGAAPPQRQVIGSRRLARAGIDVAPLHGLWRTTARERRRVIETEQDYVEGDNGLERLQARLDEDALRAGARAAGALVAQIARAGLVHRDLKLENLVVSGADPVRVTVVDTDGVRRCRDRARATARMLERLAVQPLNAGLALPRSVVVGAALSALGPLSREQRREAIRMLRAHRRR